MGKFEDAPYSRGTHDIAEAMDICVGITIVGGGETAEAVEEFGLADKMTHVSTGGGCVSSNTLKGRRSRPYRKLMRNDAAAPRGS